jgi:hypothetical protein
MADVIDCASNHNESFSPDNKIDSFGQRNVLSMETTLDGFSDENQLSTNISSSEPKVGAIPASYDDIGTCQARTSIESDNSVKTVDTVVEDCSKRQTPKYKLRRHIELDNLDSIHTTSQGS